MSYPIKIRVPFLERRVPNSGTVQFFVDMNVDSAYLPTNGVTNVLISHTNVPQNSTLYTTLQSLSTNTLPGIIQNIQSISSTDTATYNAADHHNYIWTIQYSNSNLSSTAYGDGNCTGYLEFEVNPSVYNVQKPVSAVQIVSDIVPYDLQDGYNYLYGSNHGLTGSTEQIMPMFFMERKAANSIFANTLKGLNLPVTDNELSKYTRTSYGYGTLAGTNQTPDYYIGNTGYVWNTYLTTGSTTSTLFTNPVTGYTGEYYKTVLQTIGSYEFIQDNTKIPVPNDLYLIMEIPPKQYGEIIDGKTIKLRLPYWTGSTSDSINNYLGIYSYGSYQEIDIYGTYNLSSLGSYDLDTTLSEKDLTMKDLGQKPDLSPSFNDAAYESNVVLLFSDVFGKPSENPTGSWGDGHTDVIEGVRVFNPNTREKNLYNNLNDQCVGIAYLDKGFIVITHPMIVDSFYVNAFNGQITTGGTISQPLKVYNMYGNTALNSNLYRYNSSSGAGILTYTGGTNTNIIYTKDSSNNILWESSEFLYTGTTSYPYPHVPYIEYLSYNSEKSLNVVCLASTNEFYQSTNDTAIELLSPTDTSVEYVDFSNTQNGNLYPVIITELGLYDSNGNLLAVCKPTQPIKKYWYDVVSFNIKIRL